MNDPFKLDQYIRTVADFPIPGIQFKDITPLLANGAAFCQVITIFAERYAALKLDAIIGVEARGFIFSAPVAAALGIGLVPIRKPGKLPHTIISREYALEYGTNTLEMHHDALPTGARVALLDDLLATGGTVAAACELLEQINVEIVETAFVLELGFLDGRKRLAPHPVFSLVQY